MRRIVQWTLFIFFFGAVCFENTYVFSEEPNKQFGLGVMGLSSSPSGRFIVIRTGPSKGFWTFDSYALILLDSLTGKYHFLPFLKEPANSLEFNETEQELIIVEEQNGVRQETTVDVASGLIIKSAKIADEQSKRSFYLGPAGLLKFGGISFEFEQMSSTVDVLRRGKSVGTFYLYLDAVLFISEEGYFSGYGNFLNYVNIRSGTTFYALGQLYDVFYRPDIVSAKLRGEDISELITLTVDDALKSPPPTIQFTSTPKVSTSAKVKVCYSAKSTGGGVGEVRLFHNGKLAKSDGYYREAAGKNSSEKIQVAALDGKAIHRSIILQAGKDKTEIIVTKQSKRDNYKNCTEIEPVAGENDISVSAFNSTNTVQSSLQTVTFTSNRKQTVPHLYVLAIGIDKYSDPSVNELYYAAKDANSFLTDLKRSASDQFKADNIIIDAIVNGQATKRNIQQKIDELSRNIRPSDSFILFVASHGVLLHNQYYIVTSDFMGDSKQMISSNEIVDISKKIKALTQLYIFDTCQAGGVDNIVSGLYDARMSVMAKKMGLHIYAAASSVQGAVDGYQGHGLFTHTLLDGITNKTYADFNGDKKVTAMELGKYSQAKTTEISNELIKLNKLTQPQTPLIINFGRDNPLF